MVFGFFIDVPLLTITFAFIVVFRKRLTAAIVRLGAPPILLCTLVAIPLIIFEEQIDCMPAWCGKVAVPPTLPFILIEVVVLALLIARLHATSLRKVILAFSVFGIGWEYFLGGLRGLEPSLVTVFIVPYVGLGYAFVSLLPISVFMNSTADGRASNGDSAEELETNNLPFEISVERYQEKNEVWSVDQNRQAREEEPKSGSMRGIPRPHSFV